MLAMLSFSAPVIIGVSDPGTLTENLATYQKRLVALRFQTEIHSL
jgi:hypothetical protein